MVGAFWFSFIWSCFPVLYRWLLTNKGNQGLGNMNEISWDKVGVCIIVSVGKKKF